MVLHTITKKRTQEKVLARYVDENVCTTKSTSEELLEKITHCTKTFSLR